MMLALNKSSLLPLGPTSLCLSATPQSPAPVLPSLSPACVVQRALSMQSRLASQPHYASGFVSFVSALGRAPASSSSSSTTAIAGTPQGSPPATGNDRRGGGDSSSRLHQSSAGPRTRRRHVLRLVAPAAERNSSLPLTHAPPQQILQNTPTPGLHADRGALESADLPPHPPPSLQPPGAPTQGDVRGPAGAAQQPQVPDAWPGAQQRSGQAREQAVPLSQGMQGGGQPAQGQPAPAAGRRAHAATAAPAVAHKPPGPEADTDSQSGRHTDATQVGLPASAGAAAGVSATPVPSSRSRRGRGGRPKETGPHGCATTAAPPAAVQPPQELPQQQPGPAGEGGRAGEDSRGGSPERLQGPGEVADSDGSVSGASRRRGRRGRGAGTPQEPGSGAAPAASAPRNLVWYPAVRVLSNAAEGLLEILRDSRTDPFQSIEELQVGGQPGPVSDQWGKRRGVRVCGHRREQTA